MNKTLFQIFFSLKFYQEANIIQRDDGDQGKGQPSEGRGERQFEEQHCCFQDLFGGPSVAVLFHSIERSPDRPERELLQTSPTWSLISSPLEVIFQTDESSCSDTSQLPVESSIFDEDEAATEDDNTEEGYEADISNLVDEKDETDDH